MDSLEYLQQLLEDTAEKYYILAKSNLNKNREVSNALYDVAEEFTKIAEITENLE